MKTERLKGTCIQRRIQRGAATAEMAFVLPVFFLFCWGFMMFAFILFGYCSATYAAKSQFVTQSSMAAAAPVPAPALN